MKLKKRNIKLRKFTLYGEGGGGRFIPYTWGPFGKGGY